MTRLLAPPLRPIFEAIPSLGLVIDADLRIRDANDTACARLETEDALWGRLLCGEMLRCVNAHPGPCGTTAACPECGIRQAVIAAVKGTPTRRRVARMYLHDQDRLREVWFVVTTGRFELDGETFVLLIADDVTELRALRRIVPICASCHKVHTEDDLWECMESHLRQHTTVQFSHGLCAECLQKFYPEPLPDSDA